MKGSAVISECGRYRYILRRELNEDFGQLRVCFVMLNPSTADAETDDPTIRRCIGYAREWGYRGLTIVNLYSLRSTDPKLLYPHGPNTVEPVGPETDRYILQATMESTMIVAAWGAGKPPRRHRIDKVWGIIRPHRSLYALEKTRSGAPRHPLYARKDLKPIIWRDRRAPK